MLSDFGITIAYISNCSKGVWVKFLTAKRGESMREREKNQCSDESRREFLRNSVYAACATPIVLSMLVEKASAAKSWNSGCGEITGTGRPPQNAPLGPEPGRGRNDKSKP
jgi:hypothetical protein